MIFQTSYNKPALRFSNVYARICFDYSWKKYKCKFDFNQIKLGHLNTKYYYKTKINKAKMCVKYLVFVFTLIFIFEKSLTYITWIF